VNKSELLRYRSPERAPHCQWFDVRHLLDELQESLATQLSDKRIKTVIDVPMKLRVIADRELIWRAVNNLLRNAVEAMPNGGELVITGFVGPRGLILEVADTGPGLAEKVRQHMFKPHYTTKSGALGMGLAEVQSIARNHGGDIMAANCPEGGAALTIRIPQRYLQAAA
jgi:signal transduction histidine kinase